jgi:hypothetical protein
MMHPELAKEIVKVCRSRSAEGDCPVTPPESIERLEQCIIELANQIEVLSADEPAIEAYKLFRKERQRREIAEEKLAEQMAKEPAMKALEKARAYIEYALEAHGYDPAGLGLDALNDVDRALSQQDSPKLPGHDETMANLDALTIRPGDNR